MSRPPWIGRCQNHSVLNCPYCDFRLKNDNFRLLMWWQRSADLVKMSEQKCNETILSEQQNLDAINFSKSKSITHQLIVRRFVISRKSKNCPKSLSLVDISGTFDKVKWHHIIKNAQKNSLLLKDGSWAAGRELNRIQVRLIRFAKNER